MTRAQISIAVGLAAGILAGALVIAPGLSLLFPAASLPVIFAAIGFGTRAGFIAGVIQAAITVAASSQIVGITILLAVTIPALLAGVLANLARPAEEVGGPAGSLVWFPLADIIFYTAIAVAVGFIAIGVLAGYDTAMAEAIAARAIEMLNEADPQLYLPADAKTQFAEFLARLFPALQPATMVIALTGNFYIASRIAEKTGHLARPRDDWPSALRLPRPALAAFGVALLLAMFAAGGLSLAATVVCGALGAAFMLAGLAMLHLAVRGKPWKPPALAGAYFALAFFAPAIAGFVIAGLFDTRRQANLSGPSGPSSNT